MRLLNSCRLPWTYVGSDTHNETSKHIYLVRNRNGKVLENFDVGFLDLSLPMNPTAVFTIVTQII